MTNFATGSHATMSARGTVQRLRRFLGLGAFLGMGALLLKIFRRNTKNPTSKL